MRWLVGWSGARSAYGPDGRPTVRPVGARTVWDAPDPLWAVGDWRDDELRVVELPRPARAAYLPAPEDDGIARLALLGHCPVTDDQLRGALVRAAGGAISHLTSWPGSYTVALKIGRRTCVVGDLAGARPVFHAAWAHGTAYATAALPLADLLESELDVGHLAARLACPDSPEALSAATRVPSLTTPYRGVHRVPPGHALVVHDGAPDLPVVEARGSWVGGPPPEATEDQAVDDLRDALQQAVRTRTDPKTLRGRSLGADLSGGSASSALALLAAGRPAARADLDGNDTRLLAVTFTDTAAGAETRERELTLARDLAADPRLNHVVMPGGPEALPYSGLEDGVLTDEPSPALVDAARESHRLDGGGEDHLTGHGARHALDGHPARLADLYLDHRRGPLLRPLGALSRLENPVPGLAALLGAMRRLARSPYRHGLEDTAAQLAEGTFDIPDGSSRHGTARAFRNANFAWCVPGPAARWLAGEVLTDIAGALDHAARVPDPPRRPGRRRAQLALNRAAANFRVLEQAAERRGQRLHAPFLDNQVVRACREIPQTSRVRPGARPALLRTVLLGAGVRALPDGWGAPTQPDPLPAARAGLRHVGEDILDLFSGSVLEKTGLIDPRPVQTLLRQAADGETVPLDGLAELVSTEVWLRRLLARRGSCWTGTGRPQRMAVTSVPA